MGIALTGTYTGQMLVQHLAGSGTERDVAVTTPSFFDMNLKLTYDVRVIKQTTLQFSIGMSNILNYYQNDFDRGADRDSGYIYGPTLPRSLFAGLKVTI